MRQFKCMMIVLLLSLWGQFFSVDAQMMIEAGDVIEGEVVGGAEVVYQFVARDGEMLSFDVQHMDEGLDSMLTIRDLNGTVLIENDDRLYPDDLQPLIEGFSAPYTGSYSITVTGFGETSGEFELIVSSGYSQATLDSVTYSDWDVTDLTVEQNAVVESSEDGVIVDVSGVGERSFVTGINTPDTPYYAAISVSEISGRDGWRVGLVFNVVDEEQYQAFFVNNRGAWRVASVVDGEESIVRDWALHPAIMAGESAFELAVLVQDGGTSFFYNGQYIGTNELAVEMGQFGAVVLTAEAVGSQVSAVFGDVRLTQPMLADGASLPVDSIVNSRTSNYVVRELARRLVIPAGGEQVLTLDEAFAQDNDAGVTTLTLSTVLELSDFVVGADIEIESASSQNGCGFALHDSGEAYTLVYVDGSGGYGVSLFEAGDFNDSYYADTIDLSGDSYRVVIAVVGSELAYFINGRVAYRGAINTRSGLIGEAVINFEEQNTVCNYSNIWVWRLN